MTRIDFDKFVDDVLSIGEGYIERAGGSKRRAKRAIKKDIRSYDPSASKAAINVFLRGIDNLEKLKSLRAERRTKEGSSNG